MSVWVVVHDAYGNDEVLGVYATREAAERGLVDRTPTGRRSKSAWAHDERCCRVIEREVQE